MNDEAFDEEESQPSGIQRLDGLREFLRANGVTAIVVTYDGAGDSGQVETVDGEPVEVWASLQHSRANDVGENLHDFITDAVYSILETKHPGWEINEGSFGELRITIGADEASDRIELEHNDRYETYDTTNYDLLEEVE